MVSGYGVGGFVQGLEQGYAFGHGIQQDKQNQEWQNEERQYIRDNQKYLQQQHQQADTLFNEKQTLFDQQQQDRAKKVAAQTIKQNGKMIYALTHNADGSLKQVDAGTHAQIVRLMNNTPGISDFLAAGQNVNPKEPLAGFNVTPAGMVVPELNTTDPKTGQPAIKPMTYNRSADPKDPVVAMTPSQLDNELGSFFSAHGAWGQSKLTDREKMALQHKYKLDEIAAAAEAKAKAANGGGKDPAAVRTIKWVADNMYGGDIQKAATWYKTAASKSPAQMAASLLVQAKANPFNQGKSDADLQAEITQAIKFAQSFGKTVPTGQQGAQGNQGTGYGVGAQPQVPDNYVERSSENTAAQNATPMPVNPETPPVAGARKAKDGNWYVNRNGQWFKVVQ